MNQAEQLAQGLAAMELDLPAGHREQLLAYLALLYKWNRTYSPRSDRRRDPADGRTAP